MNKSNLTIVTGLFDIGRGNISDSFKRSFDHYLESFKSFLEATKDHQLLVYIEAKNEHVVWETRNRTNTVVVVKELDYLRSFPFYSQVQTIRQNPEWYGQAGWLQESPQATLELYNPLVMMKQFMLNDASLMNHFDSKYFLWMDAGLTNTVNLSQYLDANFERRVTSKMKKMLYLCFPYDGTVEVHGFKKSEMNRYAGKETTYVARGGCFGGSKDSINRINEVYYSLLNATLSSGLMGTEESLFTLMTYRNMEICHTHMIEPNGLVYKFFEDIKAIPVKQNMAEEVAIYALTFNTPEQFSLFAKSLKDAYPKAYKTYKKYVINNSNNDAVNVPYAQLFEDHGFTEFKFDNIGINNGRQFAAEHFDQSDHEYMIFFEDDMLLHPEEPSVRCKNGYSGWQPGLLEKAIHIVQSEELDYLKLSFSEFFGSNEQNWAWFNIPDDARRAEYFPASNSEEEALRKFTKISYISAYRGLPFAVGQFHYCNWPLVFSKTGNKKVFLDTKWEHMYEQTLMSNTMRLMHEGKMKVGCLLASPINHFRKYHYAKGTRRENKHYKN
jgi:hypothetical protein